MEFVPLSTDDLPFVCDIYNYYTEHSTAVYFTEPITVEDVRGFIPLGDPLYRSFLVLSDEGERAGFCYFHAFNPRPAYRISVEVTVYLRPGFGGKGLGFQVLMKLDDEIRQCGFRNVVALIDSGNDASIHLVEKCGYQSCGTIRNVAEKQGKVLSLAIYQKELGQS